MKHLKTLAIPLLISLIGCSQKSEQEQTKETIHKDLKIEESIKETEIKCLPISESNIENTVWINTPMIEFPTCIDSLIFSAKKVFTYSCEHEYGEAHNYKIFNDSLYVEKWDVINNIDTTKELKAKEWFKLTNHGLVWVKVVRKRGDFWDEIEPEYLNKSYYKQLK